MENNNEFASNKQNRNSEEKHPDENNEKQRNLEQKNNEPDKKPSWLTDLLSELLAQSVPYVFIFLLT